MKIQFVVRYVSGLKDTCIDADSTDAIVRNLPTSYIRERIRAMYPQLKNKRLKLLHNGRVLMSHTDFLKEAVYLHRNLDEDDDSGTGSANTSGADDGVPVRIYFHCIIGAELSAEELEKEEKLDTQPAKSTTEAPKGFDRLLSQGFSRADIDELRDQFFRMHASHLPANANAAQLRELEDRWIDSSVNHEIDEFPTNIRLGPDGGPGAHGRGVGRGHAGRAAGGDSDSDDDADDDDDDDDDAGAAVEAGNNDASNGGPRGAHARSAGEGPDSVGDDIRRSMVRAEMETQKEMFVGVSVGFALGGLALLLLFVDAGGVFGRRTRMAVLCGVVINFAFANLRLWGV